MSKSLSHIPCISCGKTPTDKCHIKSKGSGGGNKSDNILMMCRTHHIQQHQYGWGKFTDLYPRVLFVLNAMGFELKDVLGVRKLVKK